VQFVSVLCTAFKTKNSDMTPNSCRFYTHYTYMYLKLCFLSSCRFKVNDRKSNASLAIFWGNAAKWHLVTHNQVPSRSVDMSHKRYLYIILAVGIVNSSASRRLVHYSSCFLHNYPLHFSDGAGYYKRHLAGNYRKDVRQKRKCALMNVAIGTLMIGQTAN